MMMGMPPGMGGGMGGPPMGGGYGGPPGLPGMYGAPGGFWLLL
jgi:hypothetical protein